MTENEKGFTNARSLLGGLAEAMNLINHEVEAHHQQTAYLTYMIASSAGFDRRGLELAVYASLLHDVGAVMYEQQESVAEIEREALEVSRTGASMLRGIPVLEDAAEIIERCQLSWSSLQRMHENNECDCEEAELCMHTASIVHLADAVSLMAKPDIPILDQVKGICDIVRSMKGTEFSEKAVEAFLGISGLEFVWFDLMYRPSLLMIFAGEIKQVSLDMTVQLTALMSRIIDFRSSFTAMHSAGVAASAEKLATLAGMSEDEVKMMRIAGYLHDAGKLRVPRAILEKPGKLTDAEFNIIKEHPYFTRLILMNIDGFGKIADWAGFHHEKLSGRGYPFHFGAEQLDTGSRIMAVADIFSAITEVRPYRAGMPREKALAVLGENVKNESISGDIVSLLEENYDEVDYARDTESRAAGKRYFDSLSQVSSAV